jgi:cytoskeletal protein CcmA (bactofilin family)
MALLGQQPPKKDFSVKSESTALLGQQPRKEDFSVKPEPRVEPLPTQPARSPEPKRGPEPTAMGPVKLSESVLATGLTIEGKISGNGPLRMAGRFKGNVHVEGEVAIEVGAGIEGEVNADTVLVVGEVHGNIVSQSRVELRESGVLIGDLKAGSLSVAAGSKMRGHVEFGWKEGEIDRHGLIH